MEAILLNLPLGQWCDRPYHLRVDNWQDQHSPDHGVYLWIEPEKFSNESNRIVSRTTRRAEKWWDEWIIAPIEPQPVVNQKLLEAKTQRFTAEGKHERVAKSLAALNQGSVIRLTPSEWRQIVEDPDLEDQFS